MMSAFEKALTRVLGAEGGYSDHADDLGGRTNFGITEAVARTNGFTGPMQELTREQAAAIYKAQYWNTLRLDQVAAMAATVAEELFDTAVNVGVGKAGEFLQRALNAFNRDQKDYPDVKVDGVVGPMTISALHAYLRKRGETGEQVLHRALNALQGARYIEISEARRENESFTYGWFLHRVR